MITIGEYTYGEPKVLEFGKDGNLTIGKFCSIAFEVTILLGGEHEYQNVSQYPFYAYMPEAKDFETGHTKGDVVIGNDVWIGYGVTILSGVTIGDGAIIGAESIITHDITPFGIVVGNPGRIIKYRFQEHPNMGFIHNRLLKIKWWDWPKEKIIEALPLLTSNKIDEFIEKYDN